MSNSFIRENDKVLFLFRVSIQDHMIFIFVRPAVSGSVSWSVDDPLGVFILVRFYRYGCYSECLVDSEKHGLDGTGETEPNTVLGMLTR